MILAVLRLELHDDVYNITHTHTTPQETIPITEGNATYKNFTKLD
jgi:hypothetical protein